MDSYLQHHGVIGQKWGVRRYQNYDGSLTNAGKEQKNLYRIKYPELTNKEISKVSKYNAKISIINSKEKSGKKLSNRDYKNLEKASIKKEKLESKNRYRSNIKKSSYMSDEDLTKSIEREKKERQYRDLLKDNNNIKEGDDYTREKLQTIGSTLGTIAAISGAAITIGRNSKTIIEGTEFVLKKIV